jgi:hypothetical protein
MENSAEKEISVLDSVIIPRLLITRPGVAVDIIIRVSQATNTDPDVIAKLVPGLQHSHWFPKDDVPGCACCARANYFRHGGPGAK